MFDINKPIYGVTFTSLQREEPILAINSPGWNIRRDRLAEKCSVARLSTRRTIALELEFDPRNLEAPRVDETHKFLLDRLNQDLPIGCRGCKAFEVSIRHYDLVKGATRCKIAARGECSSNAVVCPDGFNRKTESWMRKKINIRDVGLEQGQGVRGTEFTAIFNQDEPVGFVRRYGLENEMPMMQDGFFEYQKEIPGYLGRQEDPIYLDKSEEKIIRSLMRDVLSTQSIPETPNSGTW